jgi:hypothetical protein
VAGSEEKGKARLESLKSYVTVQQLASQHLCPEDLAKLQQLLKAAEDGELATADQLPDHMERYVTPNSALWHLVRRKYTFTGSSALLRFGLTSPASSDVQGIMQKLGIAPRGPFSFLAGATPPAQDVVPVLRVC